MTNLHVIPKRNLLKSQKSDIGNVLSTYSLDPGDFAWDYLSSENIQAEVPRLKYRRGPYEFIFDKEADINDNEVWRCIAVPGPEYERTVLYAHNWGEALENVATWILAMNREIEAEDPWAEIEEEVIQDWSSRDEKFSDEELAELDEGLKRVEEFLIKQSDKSDKTLKEIHDGIANLSAQGQKLTKKDWVTMFLTWFFTQSASWAVSQNHWYEILKLLLKGSRVLLLGPVT